MESVGTLCINQVIFFSVIFHLFRHLKKALKGFWFQSDSGVKQVLHVWFLSVKHKILWDCHPVLGGSVGYMSQCLWWLCVTEPKRSSAIKLGQVVLNLPFNSYTQYRVHYQSCRLASLFWVGGDHNICWCANKVFMTLWLQMLNTVKYNLNSSFM